jgi:colicin import membrane protein
MARKLKAFQTSVGLYDLAIAAPSMKAALEAWGAGSNSLPSGAAKETEDPEVVAATMSKPGVVLKRPSGSGSGGPLGPGIVGRVVVKIQKHPAEFSRR